jgi:hypothetical protein
MPPGAPNAWCFDPYTKPTPRDDMFDAVRTRIHDLDISRLPSVLSGFCCFLLIEDTRVSGPLWFDAWYLYAVCIDETHEKELAQKLSDVVLPPCLARVVLCYVGLPVRVYAWQAEDCANYATQDFPFRPLHCRRPKIRNRQSYRAEVRRRNRDLLLSSHGQAGIRLPRMPHDSKLRAARRQQQIVAACASVPLTDS